MGICRYKGTEVQRRRGTTARRYRGLAAQRHEGTRVRWYDGTMVSENRKNGMHAVLARNTENITMKKILIANRGEIAIRIMKTARKMKILTVAVKTAAEPDAMYLSFADEIYDNTRTIPRSPYFWILRNLFQ